MTWDRPERFRRLCPLLVRTPDGLRCSANTEDVRPFWGVAVRYYGGTALAIYAALVISVFAVLRSVGYPVSIIHVSLPPFWHKVGESRGWFFSMRAQQAFAAGRTNEGLLYLANAFEFDPKSYETGVSLAKAFQLGRPDHSDELYAKLLSTHPQHRSATAEQWFRALLARGDFEKIEGLAYGELLHEPRYANVWMRALLFATRQTGNDARLKRLLEHANPHAVVWRPLLETELLMRAGKLREARATLNKPTPANAPPYLVLHRVETLVALDEAMAALDLLVTHRSRLDPEAYLTYRLHCLGHAGAKQSLRKEFQVFLLDAPLSQPTLKMMCAQLIRHPDNELFERVLAKVTREAMPLNDDTAGGWFSLLCTAGAVRDQSSLRALTVRLRNASSTPFMALGLVENFFRTDTPDRRATVFLPFLPVPMEVAYALIEKYPGRRASTPGPIAAK